MKIKWLGLMFVILLWCSAVSGAEVRQGSTVVIEKDEVIQGDLIVRAYTAEIRGTVQGNLYVLAAEVSVPGKVEGVARILSSLTDISGSVGQSVYAVTGVFRLSGTIGNMVKVRAGNVELEKGSLVKGSVQANAGQVHFNGRVLDLVRGHVENAVLGGRFDKTVRLAMGSLVVMPGARLEGGLNYISAKPPVIRKGAVIRNGIHQDESWHPRGRRHERLLALAATVILLGCGGLMFRRRFTEKAFAVLSRRPFTAFGVGLLLVGVSMVFHLLGSATEIVRKFDLVKALPGPTSLYYVLGALIFCAFVIMAVILLLSLSLTALRAGRWLIWNGPRHRRPWLEYLSVLLGTVLLAGISLIPLAGVPLVLLLTVVSAGALVRSWFSRSI